MGYTTPWRRHSLHALEQIPVDDRLMGLEVDHLPEPNLPQVDAVGEDAPDGGVGSDDAVRTDEEANPPDRCLISTHRECRPDCRGDICVRVQYPACATDVSRRNARERRDTTSDGIGLSSTGPLSDGAAVVLADGSDHGAAEPLGGGLTADLPDVQGYDPAAGSFNPRHDLILHAQGANETVEVRDHDDIRRACLDLFNGATETLALVQRSPTRDVELLDGPDQLEPVPFAGLPYSRQLFAGRDEVPLALPHLRDSHDAHGPSQRLGRLLPKRTPVQTSESIGRTA